MRVLSKKKKTTIMHMRERERDSKSLGWCNENVERASKKKILKNNSREKFCKERPSIIIIIIIPPPKMYKSWSRQWQFVLKKRAD